MHAERGLRRQRHSKARVSRGARKSLMNADIDHGRKKARPGDAKRPRKMSGARFTRAPRMPRPERAKR